MLTTVVHFRAGAGRFCVPVEAVLEVRLASGLVPLPAPQSGVVGILSAERPITVLSVLGAGGGHVLIMAAHGQTYGLLVEEVTGLSRVEAGDIQIAPSGQARDLISGVIDGEDGMVLVADPDAMAERL